MNAPPLTGIKILDFTQAMAGPFATMLLGDLGCEVIKVEPLTGDQTRKWAPPYMNGMSSYFLSANRNKQSIAIDLKKDEGRNAVKELISKVDLVIENFRPGTMKKLGLDHPSVEKSNPALIYCSLSGYGQSGPFKDYPGYDLTLLSYTGLLGITGEASRPPVKFGVPIADIVSGLFAAVSIMSALYNRTGTGKGQYIDMSMFDANLSVLTHQAFSYFATGNNPSRLGSAHSSIAPYQAFATSDGYISIAVGTDKLWKEFTRCIGRPDIAAMEVYASNMARVRNREKLAEDITRITKEYGTEELLGILRKSGIPCAPINSVGDAVRSEQAIFREMVSSISGSYGEVETLGTPFKLSRNPGRIQAAPPMLGEHSARVLEAFGFSGDRIEMLKNGRTINSEVKKDEEL